MPVRIAVLLCLCIASPLFAGEVEALLSRATAAHGGNAVTQLDRLVVEWRFDDALIRESRAPGPPWDRAVRWQGHAVDFTGRRYAGRSHDPGSGYDRVRGTIVTTDGTYALNYRKRVWLERAPDFDAQLGDLLRYSPPALLRWLLDHPDAVSPAEGGDAVRVDLGSEQFTVRFHPQQGHVTGVEHSFTDYDGTVVPLRVRFSDLHPIDGVFQPRAFEVQVWGDTGRRASLQRFETGIELTAFLALPDGFSEAAPAPPGVRDFRVEELAEGVYFIGQGVMYQLFVEFDDFIVAMDATSGDVEKRIEAIQDRVPDKPLRYVLISHHHNDHLHGIDAFARRDVTFLASPAHVSRIRDYMDDRSLKIQTVDGPYTIRAGGRELQIIDIGPVPHSEHLLTGYLPGEKILFEADLFVLGGRRHPVGPASPNALALRDALRRHDLDVERIVDPHSPLIATADDLNRAVATRRTADPLPRGPWHSAPRNEEDGT